MTSVNEAWNALRTRAVPIETETLDLHQAGGRVLRQSLTADRDYPPFPRVAMDGYALSLTSWNQGQRSFRVQGIQTAGQPPTTLLKSDECIEIMTGAKLPERCDVVIRYEDSERRGEQVHFLDDLLLERYTNIHQQGVDCPAGATFGDAIMNAPIAGLAASFGHAQVKVSRRIRIAIIGTGDELVPITEQPRDYQIRASNIHALKMALELHGHEVLSAKTYADRKDLITLAALEALAVADIVLLSGGVSAGKTDFIPSVLQGCGVEPIFHKIAQRPGKPLWVGQNRKGTTVFGLPGNPVSTLVCLYRYVLPFLELVQGKDPQPRPYAELQGPRPHNHGLTYFLPVRLRYTKGGLILADPAPHHGSGDFAALSGTDGFLEIPGLEEPDYDESQTVFPFLKW